MKLFAHFNYTADKSSCAKGQTEEALLAFPFSPELQNSVQASELQDFTNVLKHRVLSQCISLNGSICIPSNKKLAEPERFRQILQGLGRKDLPHRIIITYNKNRASCSNHILFV